MNLAPLFGESRLLQGGLLLQIVTITLNVSTNGQYLAGNEFDSSPYWLLFDHLVDCSDYSFDPPEFPGDYSDHPVDHSDLLNYYPGHFGDYPDHPILVIMRTINFTVSKQKEIWMFHLCNINII